MMQDLIYSQLSILNPLQQSKFLKQFMCKTSLGDLGINGLENHDFKIACTIISATLTRSAEHNEIGSLGLHWIQEIGTQHEWGVCFLNKISRIFKKI